MTTWLKTFVRKILRALGVLALWRHVRRHDVVFLVLHGTADPRRSSDWTPLRSQHSPEELDRILGVLSRYYRFISFDVAVDILAGRRAPVEHALVLTFDDGYRSNVLDAFPVLRRHGAPMIVFLTVSHVDCPVPYWVDRLDFALQQVPLDGREVRVGEVAVRFSGKSRGKLRESFECLRQRAKDVCRDEGEFQEGIGAVCEKFETESGRALADTCATDAWSAVLTWEQAREAAAQGIRFGSHSQDHVRLGLLTRAEAREQLRRSREAVTAHLGECRYVAYPDGNYTSETLAVARECGYEAGVTTKDGRNRPGCDLMALRRTTLGWSRDETELLCRVSGFATEFSVKRMLVSLRGRLMRAGWRERAAGRVAGGAR